MPDVAAVLPFNQTVGETIPPDTPHAVSVSLPTWQSNVGYEEGEAWVLEKMQTGYPRFFIHKSIQRLAGGILQHHGSVESEQAMLFPSTSCATRCKDFLLQHNPAVSRPAVRILNFATDLGRKSEFVQPHLSAVLYPKVLWPTAKSFWQHTGEGISSRRAEFCQRAFDTQTLVKQSSLTNPISTLAKGPKRYQRPLPLNHSVPNEANEHNNGESIVYKEPSVHDSAQFVEERFGRNLDVAFAAQAKLAIRKRIAGSLTSDSDLPESLEQPEDLTRVRSRDVPGFSVDDVYLYSCGMNAIFSAHRVLRAALGEKKSVMYGFPYVDTLKVLEKFGAGAFFFGYGNSTDLDDLKRRLEDGAQVLALFCEFPGNPLLRTPDLKRIRELADRYNFAIVVDETIGNFLNVHVLPYVDVLVSSLTKIFSGDSNVMGGSMILNPRSKYYHDLKAVLEVEYEDNHFEEDSIYLERNSRDFVSRIKRVNHNAEAVAATLRSHPRVKQVNYPKYSDTRAFYDACRLPDGGYGGLLSATFYRLEDAQTFYDHLDTQKGPSLGTNFTLSSPFVLLAHYGELEWAAQYGCEVGLVRFSIGLEDTDTLSGVFERALAAVSDP